MKILTIIGARPQFVKAAAVSREIKKHSDLTEIIVHTGQHFDKNMSDVFFEEMQIPQPNYNLNINSVGHGAMTGRMLEGIEEIILKEKPDVVMVYGDTNSTLAGALAAKKLHVKVAHVEAGLRSFNMAMPEEINRVLTDRISDILFCPTQQAIDNLKAEGFDNFPCRIELCGDVMQDAAMYYSQFSSEKSMVINDLQLERNNYILTTIHRQENTDDFDKLKKIIAALNQLNNERCKLVLPIHPRTKKIVESNNINLDFITIPPVGYFDMIELIKHSKLVITDSGGLQKEAFFFKKQCITIREQTEWTELIEGKFNTLLPASELNTLLKTFDKIENQASNFNVNLYGNGKASENIITTLGSL
ncbi:MAG: non-hydrolyzing UDP-N-acetylglucosamine 2-epimerase [Bacteroidia bacterium]